MVSEKMMEDAVSREPEKYLGEKGLRLVARQYSIGSYKFDLLFEDRHGARLIVELQKGTLDRNHTYKILDYYDEYKMKNPDVFIELMVIATKIPYERRKRLDSHGISWREIGESEFKGIPDRDNEQIDSNKKSDTKTTLNETKIMDKPIFIDKNKNINIPDKQQTAKSQKSIIVDKYNAIDLDTSKGLFKNVFDRCDEYLQKLFSKVAKNISGSFSVEHYPTDKPDYRFRKKNIFCELVLKPSKRCLRVLLRVDSYHIDSQTLSLKEMPASKMKGTKWIYLEINDEDQLNETLNLVKKVYEFSD